jgi:hypothetical protein
MKAKEFIPAEKPRNFVAKNAKMGGAGQHKDKKKAAKQGDVKHKSKAMAEAQDVSIGDLSGMNKRPPGVDKNGRTQSQWLKLVKQKFPDAKVMQARMLDGPCHEVLPDGRRASWIKVEKQDSPSFVNPWDKAKQGVEEDNDPLDKYRKRVHGQGFSDSPEERTSARQRANQRHQEKLDKMLKNDRFGKFKLLKETEQSFLYKNDIFFVK